MRITEQLKPLVIGRQPAEKILYECRRCGSDVQDFDDHCPNCNSTSIARYEF